MAYIAPDGSVGGQRTAWKWLTDFFMSIYTILALFFTTITNPKALEDRAPAQNRTWAQRNGGRSYREPSRGKDGSGGGHRLGRAGGGGANIRGVRDIGQANCAVGGG